MVELVDDDVVEGVRGELSKMLEPAQGLDRREHDFCMRVFGVTGVVAKPSLRSNPSKGVERLTQDLFSMGNEEHTSKL